MTLDITVSTGPHGIIKEILILDHIAKTQRCQTPSTGAHPFSL